MWNQPILSANGTIGQDDFAVVSGGGADSNAYLAFDDDISTYLNAMNADAWLIFYIKNSIKIDTVVVQSEGYLPARGKLQYSDDGTTWIDCGTWEDTEQAGNSATVDCNDKLNPHSYWRLYSLSRSVNYPSKNADFGNIIINGFEGNKGEFTLSFDTNRIVENKNFARIDLTNLVAWLKFDSGVTDDFISSNNWTAYGNPTIGTTNAICENALQLDGSSGLSCTLRLGGQDFTIDGWCYVDTSTPAYARIINIFKTSNNYPMFVLEKPSDTSNRFRLFASYYDNLSSGYNGNRSTSSIDCAGRRVHFRICYSYSKAYFELYIDGERVASVNAAKYPEQEFDVRFGSNKDEDGIIGSLDELRIYNGVSLNPENTNFTPPQAIDYDTHAFIFDTQRLLKNKVTVDFDTQREVKKIWRYENYGTADLLTQSGTTVTGLADSQSKTGSAFYQSTWAKCFDIPATDEIWIKFDVYFDGSKRWRAYNGGSNNTTGITAQTTGYNYVFSNGNELNGIANTAVKNQLQTILLHMLSSSSDGVIEAWVDGEKIYTYTGDVNHGADFADIYLQSDGAGTFFSNVIISNAPLSITDAVFEIRSKPIYFDTERSLTKPFILNFDTLRNVKEHIWRYENYGTADLLSIDNPEVEPTTITHYYCYGEVLELSPYQAKYRTAFINTNEKKCFDIPATDEIWIKFDFAIDVDMSDYRVWIGQDNCKITLADSGYADVYAADATYTELSHGNNYTCLVHMISGTTDGLIEFWLNDYNKYSKTGNVNEGELFSNVYVATSTEYIWLSNVIISNAEIGFNENCKYPLELFFDTRRNTSLLYFAQIDFDSLRNVVVSKILSNDTKRNVVASQDIFNDTYRNVRKSVNFNCDVARQIPHKLIITPSENGVFTDAVNTTGVQSIEIELAAQQLTDRLTYTSINHAQILQEVQGQYLDYNFDMRIEKIKRQGILTTCQCCSDIDELLYTPINYQIPEISRSQQTWHERETTTSTSSATPAPSNRLSDLLTGRSIEVINYPDEPSEEDADNQPKALASVHAQTIADVLGKNLVISIDDFTSTVDVEAGGQTYHDLIDAIFGWSARLPHLKINCYFRDNLFFVIQRGYETNSIDITNTKHSVPIYDEELLRTFWCDKPETKTETRTIEYWAWRLTKDNDTGGGTSSSVDENGYSFDDDGLVSHSVRTNGNSRTETDYEYTTLSNGRKFLYRETVKVYEDGQLIDTQVTEHTPLGQGQGHSYSTDETGDYLGSNVGRSKGDDRNSSGTFVGMEFTWMQVGSKNQERTVPGWVLFDTSFPVYGEDKLIELTNAIKWLNRKVQQKISMDIYDFNHVIDFNDKIIFNGNEFHLESNTVIKTPRIVNKQSVTLIRWF